MAAAKCTPCLPNEVSDAAEIYLLCSWANGGTPPQDQYFLGNPDQDWVFGDPNADWGFGKS